MRDVYDIYLYQYDMKNISPLIIGTGGEGIEGLMWQGDRLLLPGTTLMGSYKDFVRKQSKYSAISDFYKSLEPKENKDGEEEKSERQISPVIFYEAYSKKLTGSVEDNLTRRSRVKINPDFGRAETGCLALNEYAAVSGLLFNGVVEIRFGSSSHVIENDLKKLLIESVEHFIKELLTGSVGLGKNSNLGYGRFHALTTNEVSELEDRLVKKVALDLTNREDYMKYLSFRPVVAEDCLLAQDASDMIWKNTSIGELSKQSNSTCYSYLFTGKSPDGFIVKAQQLKTHKDGSKGKFAQSFQEAGQYIIPASSIKGVFRNYCRKILLTMSVSGQIKLSIYQIEQLLNNLFGGMSQNAGSDSTEAVKGIVRFTDVQIDHQKDINSYEYSRIQVDRFTGGVSPNGPFKMEVCIPQQLKIEVFVEAADTQGDCEKVLVDSERIVLSKMQLTDIAVYLLGICFRDFGNGMFSIGGNRNVGLGFVAGKELHLSKPEGQSLSYSYLNESAQTQNASAQENFIEAMRTFSEAMMPFMKTQNGGAE